jgi:hypothetical protein
MLAPCYVNIVHIDRALESNSRTELLGQPRRQWDADRANARGAHDPDWVLVQPASAEEIQEQINLATARLEAI